MLSISTKSYHNTIDLPLEACIERLQSKLVDSMVTCWEFVSDDTVRLEVQQSVADQRAAVVHLRFERDGDCTQLAAEVEADAVPESKTARLIGKIFATLRVPRALGYDLLGEDFGHQAFLERRDMNAGLQLLNEMQGSLHPEAN